MALEVLGEVLNCASADESKEALDQVRHLGVVSLALNHKQGKEPCLWYVLKVLAGQRFRGDVEAMDNNCSHLRVYKSLLSLASQT